MDVSKGRSLWDLIKSRDLGGHFIAPLLPILVRGLRIHPTPYLNKQRIPKHGLLQGFCDRKYKFDMGRVGYEQPLPRFSWPFGTKEKSRAVKEPRQS